MSDGSGGFVRAYGVQKDYTISQRISLLTSYRALFERIASADGKRISVEAMCDIMDDVLFGFSGWVEVEEPLFKTVHGRQLDPHTLRNLLRCELGLNVRKLHVGTLRLVDAFLQIAERDPPQWLAETLAK